MSESTTLTKFGDFFEKEVLPALSQNQVVYVKGLGYFLLYENPTTSGRDPRTGELLTVSAKPNLFFKENFPEEFLNKVKLNGIQIIEKDFSEMDRLKQTIKEQNNAHQAVLIESSSGKKLLKIHPGLADRFFSVSEIKQFLDQKQQSELLIYAWSDLEIKNAALRLVEKESDTGTILVSLER